MDDLRVFSVPFPKGTGFKGNPWNIQIDLIDIEGRWECVGLFLSSESGQPARITASTLRKIPLSRLIQAARVFADGQGFSRAPVAAYEADLDEIPLGASSKLTEVLRGDKPSRSRLNLEHFARVAETYRTAYRRGDNPTSAVAERFQVSKSAAAKWVHRCRLDFGLLPKTSRGKTAGGWLEEEAKEED